AGRAEALGHALLEGYARRAAPPARGDLALHTAAALFCLAPHFFRGRDPHWPERTEAVLDRIESLLPGRAARTARPRDLPRRAPVRSGKLAYVCKMFPRMTETFVLNEIVALRRAGVPVRIYSILPATRDDRPHPQALPFASETETLPQP